MGDTLSKVANARQEKQAIFFMSGLSTQAQRSLIFWQEKQAISLISGLSTQAQRSLISQHFSNVHSLCGFLILCPPESQKFLIFADDPFTEKRGQNYKCMKCPGKTNP